MDDDGYVFVVDRIKDMIVTGGENAYSAAVEHAVCDYPAVGAYAVIGIIPDPTWGEAVHAVVVLRPDACANEAELREHTKSLIAGYKAPRSVAFVDALPVSGAGTVLKRERRLPTGTASTGVSADVEPIVARPLERGKLSVRVREFGQFLPHACLGMDHLIVDVCSAVHHRAVGRLLKQAVERLPLTLIERAEHLVFHRYQRDLDLGELLGTGLGELDYVPPPILGRALPLDQLAGFQLVEQPDHVRPVHGQCAGQRLLSAPAAIPEHRQRNQVTRPQTRRRQHRFGTSPHSARKVIKQRARVTCRAIDQRQYGHTPKYTHLCHLPI
jgi:hypothetical protein